MGKYCPNCKNIIADNALFCNYCGANFQNGTADHGYQQASYAPGGIESMVIEPDEKIVAVLQNSYMASAMAEGTLGSAKIFFTNKRFYAKQNIFTLSKGLDTRNVFVDLKDISGSSILHRNPIQLLILGGLFFLFDVILGAVVGEPAAIVVGLFWTALFVVSYFLKRGTYLSISYPGETAVLHIKRYSYKDVMAFNKVLRSYVTRG